MIHTIKNNKWVITTSLICILFGLLTFFTFIDKSFIDLNKRNFQLLLIFDLILLFLFFLLIIKETYKVFKSKRTGQLGSETKIKYISFFSLINNDFLNINLLIIFLALL